MAGVLTEDNGVESRSMEGISREQRNQSAESLAEWRSSEQVENGTPSTSPPYNYTDDDDCGPKSSELFGKYTWKIENFSQINKRDLKSNTFDVGGYKWYILIYPQGCDVFNHLSVFLCVANHEKLLPGWSHFAQFTIAVIHKDFKKSKHSDTLHRFWKKEHDWGWKKFLELSKLNDGFVVDDTLVVKAQIQVIREKADRPFRCLDFHYRRDLVRVYLSNVEQVCRRFIDDRRAKLSKLTQDKISWSSFRTFWLGIDPSSRWRMLREKTDIVLKVVVKHFFIEKEVTSTLIMDSLYTGLKSLENDSKNKRGEMEETNLLHPMVYVDQDMFVLSDDVLVLLERATSEPWSGPQSLPSKDEKLSHNRTKDGNARDEINNINPFNRDDQRLTELGRRTMEFFVLMHIFSRIEIAHQEVVALRRQEELIREEEAAVLADHVKRGIPDKDKRSKKKQTKQKKNNRKNKEKDNKSKVVVELPSKQEKSTVIIAETENNSGEVSDDASESIQLELDERDSRDSSPLNWETDKSETPPVTGVNGSEMINGERTGQRSNSMDDSSSNCSSDSTLSVKLNVNGLRAVKIRESPNRERNHQSKNKDREATAFHFTDVRGITESNPTVESTSPIDPTQQLEYVNSVDQIQLQCTNPSNATQQLESVSNSSIDQINCKGNDDMAEKEEMKRKSKPSSSSVVPLNKSFPVSQPQKPPPENTTSSSNTNRNATGKTTATTSTNTTVRSRIPTTTKTEPVASKDPTLPLPKRPASSNSKLDPQANPVSRPLTAPLIPPVTSTIQSVPLLSHSISSIGRSGSTGPSPGAPSFFPRSYRNAILGTNTRDTTQDTISFGSIKPESSQNTVSFGASNTASEFEFPHLDIIIDLLDEDQSYSRVAAGGPQSRPRNFSRQYSLPNDHYYEDRFATGRTFVPRGFRESRHLSHADLSVYSNGYRDDMLQDQWNCINHFDVPMVNLGAENEYLYHHHRHHPGNYSSLMNFNGYAMYRPSNGYQGW